MTFLDLDLNTKNLIRGLAEFAGYSLDRDYTALEMELKAHQRLVLVFSVFCCFLRFADCYFFPKVYIFSK